MAFEHLLTPRDQKPKRWRRRMVLASLIGHAVLLVAGVAHSMWQVDELPMPSVEVTLVAAAAPPPPPPPPAKKKTKKTRKKPKTIVQPTEIPEEPEEAPEDEGEDEGEEEGVAGGEKGGVAGGVVGGVVGGKPPPEKKKGPAMVSSTIGRKHLLINVNSPRYKPKVPRGLRNRKISALVLICANAKGQVTTVRVKKGSGTPVDAQLPSVMRRWRYKPVTRDGTPIPFCYHVNYVIN
jgi:protein TonB